MMSDQWTDRLSAYLDGELTPEDRTALERHLETCEECSGAVKQLRSLVSWAHGYTGREPSNDVWPNIAAAIENTRPGVVSLANRRARQPRVTLQFRQALAAGVLLMLVGAGSWWIARATAPEGSMAMVIDVDTPDAGYTITPAIQAARKYGPAIAELERVLVEEQGTLDSSTVRVLREQLTIIDKALAEAQEALAQDPGSDYLADHYTGMMKKKLAVLRAAARTAVRS